MQAPPDQLAAHVDQMVDVLATASGHPTLLGGHAQQLCAITTVCRLLEVHSCHSLLAKLMGICNRCICTHKHSVESNERTRSKRESLYI